MTRFAALDAASYALPGDLEPRVLSPALVVHLDRVRENLRRVTQLLGGDVDRWRPHVKTTKIPRVWAELVRAGVRSFKCATTREALHVLELLDAEGVRGGDLLVAYPLIGPALTRIGLLAARHTASRVSLLCEEPDAIDELPAGCGVFVDVNPGMNRTGVPLDRAGEVIEIARAARDRFRGVHFYDGHLHGSTRGERARLGYDRLLDLLLALERDGFSGEVVTSGTPTFVAALAHAGLRGSAVWRHRVSPGTVVYHDLRSEGEVEELDLEPAALVFSRVVSHPADGLATCDAGSKALAAEAGDPCAYALGWPNLEPGRPTEEHLPLRVVDGRRPARGTGLMLVPRHVCPTVNLADEALLLDGGKLVDVVPVSARGHELRLTD